MFFDWKPNLKWKQTTYYTQRASQQIRAGVLFSWPILCSPYSLRSKFKFVVLSFKESDRSVVLPTEWRQLSGEIKLTSWLIAGSFGWPTLSSQLHERLSAALCDFHWTTSTPRAACCFQAKISVYFTFNTPPTAKQRWERLKRSLLFFLIVRVHIVCRSPKLSQARRLADRVGSVEASCGS